LFFSLKGKKQKTKKKNKTNKKIPSSNAIQFQLVIQHPFLVLSLSHQRKRKNKGGFWRQLCKCLPEAAAHLPSTVSHLQLQALFI
jgi:hypothetical protein